MSLFSVASSTGGSIPLAVSVPINAVASNGGVVAPAGVNVATSGVGVSAVNVTSAGLSGSSGMVCGFTFLGSSGSGGVLSSIAGMASGVGVVTSVSPALTTPLAVTSVWPTVPSLGSVAFVPVGPHPGALASAHASASLYSGGGLGMKLNNKPPVMHGSFDLYAVQLETFLRRLDVRRVVENEAAVCAPTTDAQFAMMDNNARGAVLHGVPTADAELICHEPSAQAMWTRFVNKQTKREYANYIFARQQLYAYKYTPERNMNDWLREMELQRHELQHYKKVISDEEFAEILLSNVSHTHRDVVRQFSKHYDVLVTPGTQRSAPSLAQVMNALRAESELDVVSVDEPPHGRNISSV